MAHHFELGTRDDPFDPNIVKWLRSLTPGQRVIMASDLNQLARKLVAGEIRDHHADWSESDVNNEVGRRFLADENLPELYAKDSLQLPAYRDEFERFLATDLAAGADR
jgi:hypothetical protein